jgi:hypothetical protein
MTITTKPHIPTAALKSSFDQLEKALDSSTKADGSVDVKKLETALKNADPGAKLGLSAVADAFVRERTVSTGGGCGSSGSTHTVQEKPTTLTKGEVKTVLTALLTARARAEGFDTQKADGTKGKDKKLSADEAASAVQLAGTGLAADIALGALQGAEQAATAGAALADKLHIGFARAGAALNAAKGRDGSVSMEGLQLAFARLPDGVDGDALLSAISKAFERERVVHSGGGCGGGSSTTVREAPSKLTKSEVKEVAAALTRASEILEEAGDVKASALKALIATAKDDGDLTGSLMNAIARPFVPPNPPAPSSGGGGC